MDIPRSVAHLAVAASWGHVRSLNFLSHALYDADSWLLQYGREQVAARRSKAMLNVLMRDDDHLKSNGVNASGVNGAGAGGAKDKAGAGAKTDSPTTMLDPSDPNLLNTTTNR